MTKFWEIIKDDAKRTFEVCDRAMNTNAFTNKVYAMQKDGMNVSCITPPITNKTSSKELVKIVNYTLEEGLYQRLLAEHQAIIMDSLGDFEETLGEG